MIKKSDFNEDDFETIFEYSKRNRISVDAIRQRIKSRRFFLHGEIWRNHNESILIKKSASQRERQVVEGFKK